MTIALPPDAAAVDVGPPAADHDHNGVALVTADGALSRRALDRRIDELARDLGAVRRLVLIPARNDVDTVVAYLAARRGRHPALLADATNTQLIDRLVKTFDPDVVIADRGELDERRKRSKHDLHPDLALLLSTSGSTGSSKVVRLSEQNLASNANAIAEYLGLTPGDRAITSLPLHYCYGLSVLNSHLAAGASVALTEDSVVDAGFWQLFREVGATNLAAVPHTFDLLDTIGFEQMDLPTLRFVTQAGGRMRPDLVERYARLGRRDDWELFVMYGQTEATARMAYLPPALSATRPSAVGVAIPGGSLAIDDPDDDGRGEILYRGPNVMLGYAETAGDLAFGPTIDELRTGDIGRLAPDGLLEVVGRRSRFIKPFGVRIDLDDLERRLHAASLRGRCTGSDELLVVAVARADDVEPVTTWLAGHLGLPASRRRVLHLADLPLLSTGKPDYEAIKAVAGREPVRRRATTPTVRRAFSSVLGVEHVGEQDSFASLGGDSLSYVEMTVMLEEAIGKLPADWHERTVAELESIRSGRAGGRWVALDATIVVRAVAIVAVVGTHAGLWHTPGGAHALLAVAGFNFARFRLGAPRPWSAIRRLALTSMGWIGAAAVLSDEFGWPHALLLNGVFGGPDTRWIYWFVEALVVQLAVVTAVLSVPAVARMDRERPFLVACGALAVGLAVRFDVPFDWTTDHRLARPHELFWLFALGWAAARARGRDERIVVSVLAVVATPGFFHDDHRELVVLVVVALLVWVPSLPVPRPTIGVVTLVAGASLHIYLSHVQLSPLVERGFGALAATAASVAFGVCLHRAERAVRLTVIGGRRVTPAAS